MTSQFAVFANMDRCPFGQLVSRCMSCGQQHLCHQGLSMSATCVTRNPLNLVGVLGCELVMMIVGVDCWHGLLDWLQVLHVKFAGLSIWIRALHV